MGVVKITQQFQKDITKKVGGFKEPILKQGQSLVRLRGDTNILTNKRDRF